MTGIVFLVQFRVLTNLTLMGIEADVSTCVSLPKPHGLSWGDWLDPEAAGEEKKS